MAAPTPAPLLKWPTLRHHKARKAPASESAVKEIFFQWLANKPHGLCRTLTLAVTKDCQIIESMAPCETCPFLLTVLGEVSKACPPLVARCASNIPPCWACLAHTFGSLTSYWCTDFARDAPHS